ncbi:NAD(P)H-dependent flavin oxidoreductase [Pseudorhodoferax soli]|uniref:Nitronate monooxygenase n=1 Tax=Pseudorhodoferax soli TaxID=545864 RepID=A0A368XUH1_9BURK|nr:nitronate monooxygenase [Pseudorhodoferax soli]RCW71710.1 nitronate monooxygenase [Pseudorhodoferax soli]
MRHAFLGTELPIVQAPMAGSQRSRLAATVCAAGGLGSLPGAMFDAAGLRTELQALAAQVRGAWNVNFFAHQPPAPDAAAEARWRERLAPYYAELDIDPAGVPAGAGRQPFTAAMAEVLEEFQPAVVSFHFGLPAPELLARVKARGAQVWSSATTVAEAVWLQQHGADVVIAQGLEAGGHRGHFLSHDLGLQSGTMALLPQIVDAVSVPVVAAGGIADARGVQAALALGAAAVQVGTAYLGCDEAETSALHRAALRDLAAPTELTRLFTGRPARGIVNRLMRELGALSPDAPAFPTATAALAPLKAKAEAQGLTDFTSLWSGQNRSGCNEPSAARLTRALAGL